MKKKWDSNNYTENFAFVHSLGEDLTDMLTVREGGLVVDLGCGNGALTEKLTKKGYKVIGIDSSEDMLNTARKLYPALDFTLADACGFKLEKKADAVFSNAVFHWIDDHDALVENIAANLKSGGELVFEFGGSGCAKTVHNALAAAFGEKRLEYTNNFNFKSIGEFAPLLEKHGFRVEYAVLFDRPTPQKGENGLENWINMFADEAFCNIDSNTKCDIIKTAVERCRPSLYKDRQWYVDYVRLRMKAVKL